MDQTESWIFFPICLFDTKEGKEKIDVFSNYILQSFIDRKSVFSRRRARYMHEMM